MQLEVKQTAVVEKETPQGMEVRVYKCVLKGGDSGSAVKATLTLESPERRELEYLVSQQIGEEVRLSLESVNRKLTEYTRAGPANETHTISGDAKKVLTEASEELKEQEPME